MPDFYNNIPTIKKAGVSYQYTEEELKEYVKCASDPLYFAEHYVKVVHVDRGLEMIQLRPYQKKLLKHFTENRNSICLSSRQSGKCVGGETEILVKDGNQLTSWKIGELFLKILDQQKTQEDHHTTD